MSAQESSEGFPHGGNASRLRLLETAITVTPGTPKRMVLDTDTFNEVDDQYALVHVVLAPDLVRLEAVYAAPFHNGRSEGPGDGMEKSYEEIGRILDLLQAKSIPALRGATEWLSESHNPVATAAVNDLIERARNSNNHPLYVVAIGAPTNIAVALLLAPDIIENIVVVWLGGHALNWPHAREFNLRQDLRASQILFNSGVALVHIPCLGVADRLITTREEIERHVRPAGPIGAFLADRYADYVDAAPGTSKVIWDLAATGWVMNSSWASTVLASSPVLTNDMTWSSDSGRHFIDEVVAVDRDAIYADLFARLGRRAASTGGA